MKGTSRRAFRTVLVLALLVPLAVAGTVFVAQLGSHGDEGVGVPFRPGTAPWMGPIPGTQTTLAAAEAAAAFQEVPLLTPVTVKDPCTGAAEQVELLETWVNSVAADSSKQLGFVYTDGVWMSVSSVESFDTDAIKGGELAPLDSVFSPDERPTSLRDAEVRGHAAWVKDLSSDFSCKDAVAVVGSDSVPGPTDAPPIPSSDRVFDVTQTASLRWVENGVMVHLVGPFSIDDLTAIADGVTWVSA